MSPQPRAVIAHFGYGPDDAVHLAGGQAAEQAIDIVGLGLEDQIESNRVPHLGRLALDGRQHARRAEVVEAEGDDAENMASTLGQAAGQHVWGVASLTDDFLNAFQCFRGDVRSVVEDARHGLRRDPGRGGDLFDRQALWLGHATDPPDRPEPVSRIWTGSRLRLLTLVSRPC